MNLWEIPLKTIKGISESRERCLGRLGIFSVSDVLKYYPKNYENRTVLKKIGEIQNGDTVSIKCKVTLIAKRKIHPKLTITEIEVCDDTGGIKLVFFNREYAVNRIHENETYTFFGKAMFEYGRLTIKQPEFEKSEKTSFSDSLLPIYPLTQGLTQNIMRIIVGNTLSYVSTIIEETLPFEMKKKYGLCERMYAYRAIHFPKNEENIKCASERIAFEEILYMILGLRLLRSHLDTEKGPHFENFKVVESFAEMLPFELTNAQKRVIREICMDFKSSRRVNRLIQGDVGSGKTMVAAMAMLICIKNGYQAALMAPTEILARQHYEELKKYFDMFGYKTRLLVSDMKAKERRQVLEEIQNGEINVAVGTNALVFDKVKFHALGLCITDEQHRFGVNQRMKLSQKGENVHNIVMSATPIPRTLALIIYGDMDVSVIDELPKGRQKIITKMVEDSNRDDIYDFMKEELDKGNKAFVVCPLIEESETLEVKNAVEVYEKLKNTVLKNYSVGLLHGRMKSDEKDGVMADFASGKYNVIVSTTVIEVGINIPEATVMVIENADRFGLACLHQLRGRVGRSQRQSYCFLTVENKKNQKRLKIMEKTNDGFEISEEDLKNRGPGEFFGTRQSGNVNMKLERISYDMRVVAKAKNAAIEVLEEDGRLNMPENKYIKAQVENMFGETGLII